MPPDASATDEQFRAASAAFARAMHILTPYLPISEESVEIEAALASAAGRFPAWVVNWDFELGSDSAGAQAVWIDVFADEKTAPMKKLGKYAAELTAAVRRGLTAAGIERWPYLRMRTDRDHKVRA